MSLQILCDDQIVYHVVDIAEQTLHFEFDMTVWQVLTIVVDGKLPFDTDVDQHGNIIEDKFIRVDGVTINLIPVSKYILESQFFRFECKNGGTSFSNYFGQNGQTTLTFGGDLLKYFLNLHSKSD